MLKFSKFISSVFSIVAQNTLQIKNKLINIYTYIFSVQILENKKGFLSKFDKGIF